MKIIREKGFVRFNPTALRNGMIVLLGGVVSLPEGFVKIIEKLAFLE
jgi:hypothetical protein